MFAAGFAYQVPDTIQEAITALELADRVGRQARVLGGGQALVRLMRFRYESPAQLVDLRRLGLSGIKDCQGDGLRIGAMTTDAALEASPVIRAGYPLLNDVTRVISDPLIRNIATIGGSAAYAHPSGDWGPALIAAGAMMQATGPLGPRVIPVDDFFIGSYCTALGPAEILTAIDLPCLAGGGGAYMKLHRKVSDFATVGIGVQLSVDGEGKVAGCGIGMTGVALSYLRATKAQEYLMGRQIDRDTLRRGGGIAAEETHPVADRRGSSAYKREMVKVLCTRALVTAAQRAGIPVE